MPSFGRFSGGSLTATAATAAMAAALATTEASPYSGQSYYPLSSSRTDISKGPIDVSGNGRTMTLGAGSPAGTSAGQAYANAGYLTTFGVANSWATSGFKPNWATDLIIGAFTVKMAAPSGLSFFAGSMAYGSTAECGVIFAANSDGLLRVYVSGGGAYTTNPNGVLGAGAGTVADGADHKIVWAWDYKTRALYVYVDGTLTYSLQGVLATAPNALGQWAKPMYYGASQSGVTGIAAQFRDINEYAFPKGVLPVNLGQIAATYSTAQQDIAKLFRQDTKDIALITLGQSNMEGNGPTAGTNNTGLGTPLRDATWPNGVAGKRSLFSQCAAVMGASGYKLNVNNYAKGSTSLVDCWVGRVRTWSSGMWLKQGSYIAYGGSVFKVTFSTGYSGITNTITTAPVAGVTDGTVTWNYFGPDDGFRGVAFNGSKYFDPNGLCAAAFAGIRNCDSPLRVVYIAWGETDANILVTRAEYASALIALTDQCLASGADVALLGHTFGTPGGFYPIYDAALIPGLNDALAYYASKTHKQVLGGGNLYADLGVLTANPASGIGVQADGLHGNDAAYDAGGTCLGNDLLQALHALGKA